jgi:tetratricopeptide (TPR) repeat protein
LAAGYAEKSLASAGVWSVSDTSPYQQAISSPRKFRSIYHLLIGALLIYSPLFEGGTTHVATMVIRLLVFVLFLAYSIEAVVRKEWRIPKTPCGLQVSLFLVIALMSTLLSPYKNQSTQWFMICLTYAALFYLVVGVLDQWRDVARLRAVVLVMAVAEALVVLLQLSGEDSGRATGTFFNPNFLASYLATAAVLGLAAFLYSNSKFRCSGARDVFWHHCPLVGYVLVLGASLAAILATGSRGGALALAAGASTVVLLRFGRRGLIGISLVVALTMMVPNPVRDRIITEHANNPMAYSRWHMWHSAAEEISRNPLGVGIGLYQYVYPRMAFPVEGEIIRYGKVAYTPHSEYLQVGVELGVLGLVVFLLAIWLVEREGMRLLRERLSQQERGLAVGLFAATIVALVHAAVDSNFHEPALAILYAFSAAGIVASRKLSMPESQRFWTITIPRPGRWIAVGVGLGGLLLIQVVRVGMAYQQYEVGGQLLRIQQLDQAMERFQQAIRLDSGKSLYHHALAGAYLQQYQRVHDEKLAKESIREFRIAIDLNPLDGRLHGLLAHVDAAVATVHFQAGAAEEGRTWLLQAVDAYDRAIALEPFMYTHRFELAHVLLALGQRARAEELWLKVTELEPNFLPARDALVQLFVQTGRRDDAAREYGEIVARRKIFSQRHLDPHESTFIHIDLPHLERLIANGMSAT